MHVELHANATTTPRIRGYIQASPASVATLAAELGISQTTVRRWRGRDQVTDRSHARHRLGQSTTLAEEALICGLRTDVRLGLDDLVEVMQRCVRAELSRSAIYRCLRRYGLSGLPAPAAREPVGHFASEPFGFVHVDLKHLTRLQGVKAYVFVAIERVTHFVHVEIASRRDATTIAACLERFLAAFGHSVHTILSDNGSEFTDRFGGAYWQPKGRAPSGRHPFDLVCAANGITHRLTKPYHPQTNGMVERFNRRIAEAIRSAPPAARNTGKNRFDTHDQRNAFIQAFVHSYNQTRLRCLNYQAPTQILANQTENNTQAGTSVFYCCITNRGPRLRGDDSVWSLAWWVAA
ncbi:MAG TPA: IS481 family transposase [Devosia sp.]|nr:IS481 family transposase [Devosia sp.]